MNPRTFLSRLLLLPLLAMSLFGPAPRASAAISPPTLKWAYKGCNGEWCQTGWYASPAVADLDDDGQPEVIGAAYAIFVLDGSTGSLKWKTAAGHDRRQPAAQDVGRTWPDVAVADVDNDGSLEIVTAHAGGWVSVYNNQGFFKPGWPRQPTPGSELRSLGLYDLEGDGRLEILVAATRSDNQWYVFEPDGSLRPAHWPQHSPDSDTNGYTAGCYNQNLAAGDLDGDGRAEIVGPNDTHYLAAFQDDGSQVRASGIYGKNPDGSAKVWSRVGVHVDQSVDLRGYANCGAEHRPNFADSAPLIVDVNNDGTQEAVVVGNVYNCGTDPYTSLYQMPYILNADRTRWKSGGYDWTVLPKPDGKAAPISEDYNEIENSHPNPVAADLDGDGNLEILFPSYDGRLHAYWLDKTEHGAWPFTVTGSGSDKRFASEPAVADLNNDGKAEVIFTSWTKIGSNQSGKLFILDDQGSPLPGTPISLPVHDTGNDWNGALAAPTLADIDGDGELEVVLNTAHSGLVAYDLPGSANARILWGTGRGSYQRSGSLVPANLGQSSMRADPPNPHPADSVTLTLTLRNMGPVAARLTLANPVPPGLAFVNGSLTASSGSASYSAGAITWTGSPPIGATVTLRYTAQVTAAGNAAQVIHNTATLTDEQSHAWPLHTALIVNADNLFLPYQVR